MLTTMLLALVACDTTTPNEIEEPTTLSVPMDEDLAEASVVYAPAPTPEPPVNDWHLTGSDFVYGIEKSWSESQVIESEPGEKNVSFGTWTLRNNSGRPIGLEEVTATGFIDTKKDWIVLFQEEAYDNHTIAKHFASCKLVDTETDQVLMEIEYDGETIPYANPATGLYSYSKKGWTGTSDKILVKPGGKMMINLTCDRSVSESDADYLAMAFDLEVTRYAEFAGTISVETGDYNLVEFDGAADSPHENLEVYGYIAKASVTVTD